MEKIRARLGSLSLRNSLLCYITAFLLLAVVLSVSTSAVCDRLSSRILDSYPDTREKFYLTNEKGERLGDGTYISRKPLPLSETDERITALLDILPVAATYLYSAGCIIAAAFLFYRNKLKKPLEELRNASQKIAESDLDFTIRYNSNNELGTLCTSFERMRTTLADNFAEMWRQVEERSRLNAAFAHDLRTPLTVLKGYSELLQTNEQPQTREIAATMGKHISRMESYVSSMSHLRRLEDARPEYQAVPLQPFLHSLEESARIVCDRNQKRLRLQNETSAQQLSLDPEFVSQVCSNLIANAVRFAASCVTLSFACEGGALLLTVSDDGKGFETDSLSKAADPYYTGETDRFEHFGLGLYICRLLCERHGGTLLLANTQEGAEVSASFQIPG